jgi:hypothetical protein
VATKRTCGYLECGRPAGGANVIGGQRSVPWVRYEPAKLSTYPLPASILAGSGLLAGSANVADYRGAGLPVGHEPSELLTYELNASICADLRSIRTKM